MMPHQKTKMVAGKIKFAAVFSLLIALAFHAFGQAYDSTANQTKVNKRRLNGLVIISLSGYAAGMAGLNELWYKNQERQSFKFFNDNPEWKQVDKLGHFYSAFHLSNSTQRAFLWTGVGEQKSTLIGALAGFALLAPIEIFDGYSKAYGASAGDLIADAGGSLLFYGQQSLWHEIRITPKFSYHHSKYAVLRSDILGNSTSSRILKDYNGQTLWLSVDVDKFVKGPKWLNIAAGYGAEEMIYGRDDQNTAYGLKPHRQFYLALDPDLTAVRTNNKTVRTLLFLANMIKIPAPTLEFSRNKFSFHALYF
jgi:hypothetical protein